MLRVRQASACRSERNSVPEPPMSTLRQIEANRRNAQHSTGPTSVTGKAVSSMNALKTGIHAKSLLLPSENQADLDQLIDEYYQSHRPTSPEARLFVDELIHCEWTLRRLRAAETQLWQYQNQKFAHPAETLPLGEACSSDPRVFSQLQWRVDSTRRAYHRALQALEKIKSEPAPVSLEPPALQPPSLPPSPPTTSPQIGFVPATPTSTPSQPTPKTRKILTVVPRIPFVFCKGRIETVQPLRFTADSHLSYSHWNENFSVSCSRAARASPPRPTRHLPGGGRGVHQEDSRVHYRNVLQLAAHRLPARLQDRAHSQGGARRYRRSARHPALLGRRLPLHAHAGESHPARQSLQHRQDRGRPRDDRRGRGLRTPARHARREPRPDRKSVV